MKHNKFLVVSMVFIWLSITSLLISFGCNNEPKQPETVASDTVIFQSNESSQKDAPPLGAQGIEGEQPTARGLAAPRAFPEADTTFVQRKLNNGTIVWDTVIYRPIKKAVSYSTFEKVVKLYLGPTPPQPPVNKPPISNAGIDKSITLPISVAALTGSGTDPDGTIASYLWTKVSGPAPFVFGNATAATTSVSTLIQGDYLFRLTVKDNGGVSASDDVKVTVNAVTPPIPTTGYLSLPLSTWQDLSGKSNIVIENKRFKDVPGHALRIANGSNITVRNCFFDGTTDDNNGELIEIEDASNVTITNCLFNSGTTGVYAINSNTIKINNNQFVNFRMRPSGHRGQFIQFNSCGGSGNEIMNNKGENFDGESNAEDMVSLYGTSGTASSPFRISGNMFRGGCPSTSGGGIIAGDNNGSYTIIENNSVMNPGQYGLAIAGGHDIKILNNKIYSDKTPCSNNPLYMWAQAGASCSNNLIQGNFVNWTDKSGNKNNGWNAQNCSNSTYDPSQNKPITKSEMNFPVHLIDFVTPAELLIIRK